VKEIMINFIKISTMETNASSSWQVVPEGLYRKFKFKNFIEAFGFMTKVAFLAEKKNHHPTWTNSYNTVEIWLITHDAGNQITEKDQELSNLIDQIL